jgi:hypothetical protein
MVRAVQRWVRAPAAGPILAVLAAVREGALLLVTHHSVVAALEAAGLRAAAVAEASALPVVAIAGAACLVCRDSIKQAPEAAVLVALVDGIGARRRVRRRESRRRRILRRHRRRRRRILRRILRLLLQQQPPVLLDHVSQRGEADRRHVALPAPRLCVLVGERTRVRALQPDLHPLPLAPVGQIDDLVLDHADGVAVPRVRIVREDEQLGAPRQLGAERRLRLGLGLHPGHQRRANPNGDPA